MTKSNHPLEEINFGVIGIERYRGCLVTKIIGGWECFGRKSTTPEGIDLIIDEAGSILSESITVVNDGSISCQNAIQTNTDTFFENEWKTKG